MHFVSGLLVIMSVFVNQSFATDHLSISDFTNKDLSDWNEKEFQGKTLYERMQKDGQWVLKASSKDSASGLFLEKTVSLKDYPFVNWRWQTTNRSDIENETVKEGDDYTARIYLIVDGGLFFWNTKALNYVWSNSELKNSQWPNAFAPNNAKMIAVRSKQDAINQWHTEKRNVLKDFKLAFGDDIDQIDGIAIMTDTDNAEGEAVTYFGDIYFSKD